MLRIYSMTFGGRFLFIFSTSCSSRNNFRILPYLIFDLGHPSSHPKLDFFGFSNFLFLFDIYPFSFAGLFKFANLNSAIKLAKLAGGSIRSPSFAFALFRVSIISQSTIEIFSVSAFTNFSDFFASSFSKDSFSVDRFVQIWRNFYAKFWNFAFQVFSPPAFFVNLPSKKNFHFGKGQNWTLVWKNSNILRIRFIFSQVGWGLHKVARNFWRGAVWLESEL